MHSWGRQLLSGPTARHDASNAGLPPIVVAPRWFAVRWCVAITVVDLLKERKAPTVARIDEPVEVAVERMMEHDFSQLPVVKPEVGEARLVGMVSMTSIARAALHTRSSLATLQVMHALEPKPVRIKLEATMWDALELLQHTKALLVVDGEDRLRGLLTDYDCATELRRRSENLLALEDVEVGIRLIIRSLHRDREADLKAEVARQMEAQPKSAIGSVRRIVNDCLASLSVEKSELPNDVFGAAFRTHFIKQASAEFERLDFSHYVDILLGSCWAACKDAFRLPQAEVRGLLDIVRLYRNRLAHHRDPLTHVERDRLMYCRDLIRT